MLRCGKGGKTRALIASLILFATFAQAQPAADIRKQKLGDAMTTERAAPASSIPDGQGNLPPDFYPKSPCIKPDAAGIGDKPRDARDVKAVDEYNRRIQTYNTVAQTFNGCVTDYAAKARNDIDRIQAAIRDANAR